MFGMTVHVASPLGYELPGRVRESRRIGRDGGALRLFTDPHEAVSGVDAVYTDVWTSMGQEDERAERLAIFCRLSGERGPDGVGGRARSSCTACQRTAAKR